MKKLIRSRKGFTLLEITIVVAIIVILAGVSFVGIKAMLQNANKNSTAVELHAGAWYVTKDFSNDQAAADEGYYPYVINGTRTYVKVVPKGSDENAKYWSDWDDMYEQVRNINAVTPMPQSGGSGGLNPGTGDPGSGGSGSAGQHTQSSSDMLKEFLEHYGIPYTENGGNITWNHDGDYGGQSFSDAWNQWKKDHANSTGGGSSGGGNNVSTGGSGSSGSGSGSTGGSGSSGSGSSGSGSSGSGSESGSGSTGSTGSVTSNGMSFSTGAGGGTRGVIGYTTNGNTTTFNITDLQGQQNLEMTITKNGNNYVLDMGSAKWNINYQFPGYNYSTNDSVYTLNAEQKQWLTNTYGITFN